MCVRCCRGQEGGGKGGRGAGKSGGVEEGISKRESERESFSACAVCIYSYEYLYVCMHVCIYVYTCLCVCVCVRVRVDGSQEGGHTLRAWLIEAREPELREEPQKGPTKPTLLIQAHGAGRDRRSWLRHTSFLRAAGYACLAFDFTDHGTYCTN
jgi:hypothetical protein